MFEEEQLYVGAWVISTENGTIEFPDWDQM